mmetsp:Transcript_6467/g.26640  ORF Transcript_6467/g.26640 Transcript_6467/m.26640 type:complete len:226 (-) Transcript_6467:12-689(-)
MRRESRRPRRLTRDDLGLPGGTRTPDLLLRRQLLYPVELRADAGRHYQSTALMIALPIPISAAPEIRPAQIGSMPCTQTRWPGVPACLCRAPMKWNNSAPTNMPNTASGGSTTPRPVATAERPKRPLVRMRATSIAMAASAATTIDTTTEIGRLLTPRAMMSATPFHCSALGKPNWSDTIDAVLSTPLASGFRNSSMNSGEQTSTPARLPMTWPMACWRGLPPGM